MLNPQIIKKLEFYCAYQERCISEVKKKCKSLDVPTTAIDDYIAHLIEDNFINETRFSIAFCRGKHLYKKWGKRRIIQELKLRQISQTDINTGLEEINECYTSTFFTLADKKWEDFNANQSIKQKNKWLSYLMRKGYENHLIYEALKNLEL